MISTDFPDRLVSHVVVFRPPGSRITGTLFRLDFIGRAPGRLYTRPPIEDHVCLDRFP